MTGGDPVLAAAAVAADLVGSSSDDDVPLAAGRPAPAVSGSPAGSGGDAMVVTKPGPAAAGVGKGKARGKAVDGVKKPTPGRSKAHAVDTRREDAAGAARPAAAQGGGLGGSASGAASGARRVGAAGVARPAAAEGGGPGGSASGVAAGARRVCAAGVAKPAAAEGGGPDGPVPAGSRSEGDAAVLGGGVGVVSPVGAGRAVASAADPGVVDPSSVASSVASAAAAAATVAGSGGVGGLPSSVLPPGASSPGGSAAMGVDGGGAPIAGRRKLLPPVLRLPRVTDGAGGGASAATPARGDGGSPLSAWAASVSGVVTPLLPGPARVVPFGGRRAAEPVSPFGAGRAADLPRSLPDLVAAVRLLPLPPAVGANGQWVRDGPPHEDFGSDDEVPLRGFPRGGGTRRHGRWRSAPLPPPRPPLRVGRCSRAAGGARLTTGALTHPPWCFPRVCAPAHPRRKIGRAHV